MKTWHRNILFVGAVVTAIVFLPSTILLFTGMVPTLVAFIIDKSRLKLKFLTVGCMNLAFCFPYWLDLVMGAHSVEKALEIITPQSLIRMYLGAIMGYALEWVCVVSTVYFTRQRNRAMLKKYKKDKDKMVEKWGKEVTGRVALDTNGLPIDFEELEGVLGDN